MAGGTLNYGNGDDDRAELVEDVSLPFQPLMSIPRDHLARLLFWQDEWIDRFLPPCCMLIRWRLNSDHLCLQCLFRCMLLGHYIRGLERWSVLSQLLAVSSDARLWFLWWHLPCLALWSFFQSVAVSCGHVSSCSLLPQKLGTVEFPVDWRVLPLKLPGGVSFRFLVLCICCGSFSSNNLCGSFVIYKVWFLMWFVYRTVYSWIALVICNL
jgi:hypothetical protein